MSTLKDVARGLTRKSSLTKTEAETFVQLMFDVAKQGMGEDGTVKIKGLGTFKLMTVKQRESVNVNTGERVIIDSHDRISFTPDANMRDLVNKPFAHFETVVLNDGVDFDEMSEVNTDEDEEETPQPEPVIRIVHTANLEPEETDKPEKAETVEAVVEQLVELNTEQEVEQAVESQIEPVFEQTVKPEPVLEQTVEPETEQAVDQEVEQIEHNKHMGKDKIKRKIRRYRNVVIIALLSLFMLVVGFVIGRATANYHLSDITSLLLVNSDIVNATVVPEDTEGAETKKEETAPDTVKVVKNEEVPDSVNKKPEVPQEAEKQTAPKEPVKTVAQKETPKETPKAAPAKVETPVTSSKYDADPRVRTGAYRIIGVAQTVTAKEGQTIESISKTYLGPGMECYVEALNGKDVKAGQKVKIPQLQLKKAARQ